MSFSSIPEKLLWWHDAGNAAVDEESVGSYRTALTIHPARPLTSRQLFSFRIPLFSVRLPLLAIGNGWGPQYSSWGMSREKRHMHPRGGNLAFRNLDYKTGSSQFRLRI